MMRASHGWLEQGDSVFWPSTPVCTCESAMRRLVTVANGERDNSRPPLAEKKIHLLVAKVCLK